MPPRVAVSQITTFRSSFADDVRAYAAAGFDGIGIWELKLDGDDEQARELLAASGLELTSAIPQVPSILPLPLLGGPEDPAERVDALCRSLERLAPFDPPGVVCLTGSGMGRSREAAREAVVDGLRTVAGEAERLGLQIALEPHQREGGDPWSIVGSIPEAVELIRDAGEPAALGLQFDVWHLWNTPTLFDDIEREIDRIVGVHVCDRPAEPRAWADRVWPGEGIADVPAIVGALDAAGWDGPYDIEIFSDDGTFGSELADSLWALPETEALRRARAAFERCWSTTPSTPQEAEETR